MSGYVDVVVAVVMSVADQDDAARWGISDPSYIAFLRYHNTRPKSLPSTFSANPSLVTHFPAWGPTPGARAWSWELKPAYLLVFWLEIG